MARISVPQNAAKTPLHTLFQGQIPRRIVFGCVSRDAFNGHSKHNPFVFQPFGIKEVSVTAGGVTYYRDPLRCNFNNNQYLRAYLHLMESMSMGSPSNKGCDISPKLYKSGMCLFAFDLTPDEEDGPYWELSRHGGTALDVHFNPPLPEPIEIIIYAEFDSLIKIDTNREAHLNYLA